MAGNEPQHRSAYPLPPGRLISSPPETDPYRSLLLSLTHYEAATVCGALAYVLDRVENDIPPARDEGILRDVSSRLQTLLQRGGRR